MAIYTHESIFERLHALDSQLAQLSAGNFDDAAF